jgi:hypothetical protein
VKVAPAHAACPAAGVGATTEAHIEPAPAGSRPRGTQQVAAAAAGAGTAAALDAQGMLTCHGSRRGEHGVRREPIPRTDPTAGAAAAPQMCRGWTV